MAFPGGGAVFLNIPHALSEETLDFLRNLNDPVFSTGLPEADDVLSWSRLQEMVERHALSQTDQLVERFAPAIAGFALGGVPVLDVRPRNWRQEHKVAIYTHGGGFNLYSAASTLGRAALFADDTALRVISVDYTLAPLATFEEITDQVVTVVQTVLNEGYRMEDLLMLGEASGGGLALAAILKLRNLGLGLPAAAVLISPCIDLDSADDTDYTPPSGRPSSLMKGTEVSKSPGEKWNVPAAPVYADFFKGFSSTLIQGSTGEAWLNDFFRLYHILDVAGVQVRLDLYEEVPHGFQFRNPDAPESQIARRKMREFARLRLTHGERPDLADKGARATLEISRVAKRSPDTTA
jgi:epsilon-lactone hydrolase